MINDWSQAAAGEVALDLAAILGVGGPAGLAGAILVFLGMMWRERRKENREDRKTDRESESGIVETTSALTKLVREQMLTMATRMGELEAENRSVREDLAATRTNHALELERMRSDHEIEMGKMREQITGLQIDNERLRRGQL